MDIPPGNIQFKIFSFVALYSILIYILLSTIAIITIVEIKELKFDSYYGVINRTLTFSLIVPQLVMPILSWIHLDRMQRYIDRWFDFQKKFEKVTETNFLTLSEAKPPLLRLAIHYIGTGVVFIVALPYFLSKFLKWYHLLAFYAGLFSNLLHFWYWIMTAHIITIVTKKLHSSLKKEISKSYGYTHKIEEYRLLWIDINYLIRESASCNGLVVSFFIFSNMFTLTIVTYNAIFRLPTFLKADRYDRLLSSWAPTLFFWNYMMTYCSAGYRMTQISFNGIFDALVLLQRDGSHKEELYISMFLSTIRIYSAQPSVSGFFIINRNFFGSISMYIVTLIIVLEQFSVNRNETKIENMESQT